MKVLFLSVTTGHGHHQTAYAVMECLKNRDVECEILDTYEYINPILSDSIAHGYLISTKFTPAVYGRLYRMAEKMENKNIKYSINKIISSIFSKKLESYIDKFSPDVIVCTHIFAAQILCQIKRKKEKKFSTIGIITDFTIHPFWEETDLDYYITASSFLDYQLQKKGIPLEKVRHFGIPVFAKFSKKDSKETMRKELNLKDKYTICIMGGSMGYGNVIPVIKKINKLEEDLQIVCICGNNKRMKNRVDALKLGKDIHNYGFVDFVDKVMDASDCIITKPGGLTVSESLAKEIPMILFNPIPGQEDRNMEFLINNGIAMRLSNTYTADEAIFQLINSEFRQKHMMEGLKYFSRPNASDDLCDLIVGL
jgi:processive 1,2-diacylglycerol beta-glucosyltransferase